MEDWADLIHLSCELACPEDFFNNPNNTMHDYIGKQRLIAQNREAVWRKMEQATAPGHYEDYQDDATGFDRGFFFKKCELDFLAYDNDEDYLAATEQLVRQAYENGQLPSLVLHVRERFGGGQYPIGELLHSLSDRTDFPHVTSLDLSFNALSEDVLNHLSRWNNLENITALNLTDSGLDSNLLHQLTTIPKLKNITSLNLSVNSNIFYGVSPRDYGNLIAELSKFEKLTSLDMSDTVFIERISSASAISNVYSNFLQSFDNPAFKNLTSLSIGNNTIGSDIRALAQWKHLKNLTSLDLSDNELDGNIGELSRCPIVQNLTSLNLSRNDLSGHIKKLAKCQFQNLATLDLSNNNLNPDDILDLSHCKNLENLTSLNLLNSIFCNYAIGALAKCTNLKNLTSLNITPSLTVNNSNQIQGYIALFCREVKNEDGTERELFPKLQHIETGNITRDQAIMAALKAWREARRVAECNAETAAKLKNKAGTDDAKDKSANDEPNKASTSWADRATKPSGSDLPDH